MSDYNADPVPDVLQMTTIARNYNLCADFAVKSDQWSIDSANRVQSFATGEGLIRCKVKFDPHFI